MGDLGLHLAWMQLSIPYKFSVLFLVLERFFFFFLIHQCLCCFFFKIHLKLEGSLMFNAGDIHISFKYICLSAAAC